MEIHLRIRLETLSSSCRSLVTPTTPEPPARHPRGALAAAGETERRGDTAGPHFHVLPTPGCPSPAPHAPHLPRCRAVELAAASDNGVLGHAPRTARDRELRLSQYTGPHLTRVGRSPGPRR